MKDIFKKIFLFILPIIICSCSQNTLNYTIDDSYEKSIDLVLNKMSLDEKIGQLLIITINGNTFNEENLKLISDIKPGGVILMEENYSTYDKTLEFIKSIKENSNINPFIATDEEGGNVQRLLSLKNTKVTKIPDMYSLGKTNDEAIAYELGTIIGKELSSLGINLNFAPVLDIGKEDSIIGKRSIASDKNLVSKMGIAIAKGMEETGVIATYKHFPGYGKAEKDAHYYLPIINSTYEEMKDDDLVPFINVINNNAKIIMVGHQSLPNITGENIPSSLSKKIITDILINDLGYEGLIITDALNMKAVTKNYTDKDIYINAINAGNDLLLMPNNPIEAINFIKGSISEERINKSVKKILTYKYLYLKDTTIYDPSLLNDNAYNEVIDKIKK